MVLDDIKEQILTRLKERLNLRRVILFGSYAGGAPAADSDIDLLVVLDDDFMPESFEENMRSYLEVSSALGEIRRTIPIDLIVHTRPMHEKFLELGSMFARELTGKGEVLYEKSD